MGVPTVLVHTGSKGLESLNRKMPQSKGSKAYEWVPNDKYCKTESSGIDRVVEMIQCADKVVVTSSLLLADYDIRDALTETGWRGQDEKRCYVMTTTASRLLQDVDREFDEKSHRRHIEVLESIAGKVLVRLSDDFHASVVLADPGSDTPDGLLLTASLSTEELESSYRLAVELKPDEVRLTMSILRWAFWEHSTHEIMEEKIRDCKPLGEINPIESKKILQTGPHYTAIKNKIMEILDGNPKKIIVGSVGWDARHAVVKKLCGLSRQGVNVTVLTRSEMKSTYGAIKKMKKAGIRILGFSQFHAGVVISDSDTLVMSASIEKRGLEDGFEIGLILKGKRAKEVKKTVSSWMGNYQYEFKEASTTHGSG